MKRITALLCCMLCLMLAAPVQAASLISSGNTIAGQVTPVAVFSAYDQASADALVDDDSMTWMMRCLYTNDEKAISTQMDTMFVFGGSTIDAIWIRNGCCANAEWYAENSRPRTLRVTIGTAGGQSYVYRYQMTDAYDMAAVNANWNGGYQRLLLPQPIGQVSSVSLFIEDWYAGSRYETDVYMTDVIFTSPQPAGGQPALPVGPTGWVEDMDFDPVVVEFAKDDSYRSYAGPNRTDYAGTGVFKSSLVVEHVYYRENNYVYCEVHYGQQKRRIYLSDSNFEKDLWKIPAVSLSPVASGTTITSVTPRSGPGKRSDGWYTKYEDFTIPSGTSVMVFFRDYSNRDEPWLFCEFYASGKLVRAWLPEGDVQLQ